MKRNFSIFYMFASVLSFAQVGINTSNPQTVYHVDGGKDNPLTGVPTAAQQLNDFVVTSAGNVGIGTIVPQKKLDIDANNASLRIRNLPQQLPADHDFLTINTANGDVVATRYVYTANITVQPGANGTLTVPANASIPNGMLVVKTSNSCGINMITNFIYSDISLGYATAIAGDKVGAPVIAPIPGSGAGSGIWSVKFPGTAACTTGNETQFDYTVSKPTASSYLIVNNGNVARTYVLTMFRL
ncbi:hypothetical protein [Chryseobacterium vrystaatense]|uniref:Uncharacterized protein n=1 Tax=Chryseobacterium vrystaatense TaxID=307480 RepID=A0A1M5KWS7_9FLAO|nr:hypothetical protein [Chryseobacterium vrystaatense]KFF24000.1 hypothetical protein IW16_21705 [Chryseobacterium vrystaatense]SHG56603.1 hypothetical protein SAMN02787073_4478 [Chryseobacterium vrystaatense]